MAYLKHRLKPLALSLLATSVLMAFAATGATASGKFTVEEEWTATIKGQAENTLENRLWVLGLNLEIFCHEATATGSINSSGTGTVTVEFKKCLGQGVNGSGTLVGSACEIPDNIVAKASALVILHEGNEKLAVHEINKGLPYLLLTPQDGLTFATIINKNEECLVPDKGTVKGSLVASISNPHETNVQKLLSTKSMLNLFGSKLLYGSNEAHLDADMQIEIGTVTRTAWRWGAL